VERGTVLRPFALLADEGVAYELVGGVAVNLRRHAEPTDPASRGGAR